MIAEIPLESVPAQSFVTTLDEIAIRFTIKWNDRSGVWTMDLFDNVTNDPLLYSIPLVLGQDLLEAYNLNIGAIIMVDTANQGIDAGVNDLGYRVKMYWLSMDELDV